MNTVKKVYLAILNGGNLRREMTTDVIPAMQKTPGVKLVWEHPGKTWANPISSNRNKIVKRFLDTDCDFLLMIDDDVVPLHNPCEMAYANKDIIASPALVRSAGSVMNWTAYIPHGTKDGYSALDLNSFDDMIDVLEVAVVGTGCILVKREVLENVKQPFHSEFDEDGIQTYGTDFAFCRRATAKGYEVWTMMHRRCEHFKTVGFSDLTGWDPIDYFDRTNAGYNMPWGDCSIIQRDWQFIKKYIDELQSQHVYAQPLKILEFGSGLSSLLMSEICEVISLETNSEYKKLIESKITEKNNLKIHLWDGVNVDNEMQCEYGITQDAIHKPFGLVFVDGPENERKGGIGRNAAIKIASLVSDHVILHDAGRCEEEQHQRKYLRSIFKLIRKSGSHITRCHYWARRPKPVTIEDVTGKKN